jgi:hypothetical protein
VEITPVRAIPWRSLRSGDRSLWASPSRSFPDGWVAGAGAVALLIALAVIAEWDRLSGPAWIGMDTATAFFGWYTFLGEQLRQGHIPVWNPHTFSGAPFAADPESGWMYLPVMLTFTVLPLDAAVRASLLFHVLLASLSTYALARSLGANLFGGLTAATVYAHSGFFEGHNVCCYAYADVAAWLPLALLGAERATRCISRRSLLLWCGLAGFAMSQILAAWIGQGAYYATLVVGSYIALRSVRVRRAAAVGAAIAAWTFSLAAAGLLPRLEYNAVSNLPGGYPGADVSLRATTWNNWGLIDDWQRLLLQPGFEYIGLPALLLAFGGLALLVRRNPAWPVAYFAALGLFVLILARAQPTPLHALFSLLPGFERIHARSPERALIVFYLAPAILASASMTWLTSRFQRWRLAATSVGALILVVLSVDLHAAWLAQATESLNGGGDYQFARVDLASYLAPTPGAQFLMAQREPFRYFGYAGHVLGGPMPYTLRWTDPGIAALEVNNRAMLTGLEDTQGYNPVHVARYDDFVATLNGQTQNYHHADVFERGFDSPLLDLLNVRYVILPKVPASDEVLPHYQRTLRLVYQDDAVRIFENPSAMPRAWLVHSAVQGSFVARGTDLHRVALLEVPPPPLAEPEDASAESVRVQPEAPDRTSFRVRAAAPALLVASEITYPAWHAYLDGQPASIYAADGALRAVAIPAGEHVVEMRYESPALDVGVLVSGFAAALVAGIAILHCVFSPTFRDGSGEVRCKTGAVPQL